MRGRTRCGLFLCEQPHSDSFDDVHRHGITEALVALRIADALRPSIGEALETFALDRGQAAYRGAFLDVVVINVRTALLAATSVSDLPLFEA